MELSKGDLVLINFNPSKGQEMGKLRPAVVVSNDQDNEILPTIIVIPLSTVLLDDSEPYRLRIKARDRLEKDSDACVRCCRLKTVLGNSCFIFCDRLSSASS